MLTGLTLIDVHTLFTIILGYYVTGVTGADVTAVGDIVTSVCTTTAIVLRAIMTVI